MEKGNSLYGVGIDILFVLVILLGLILQFGLQVILGEDPVVSSLDEFGLFAVISLIVFGGTIAFLRYRKSYLSKGLTIFVALLVLGFWLIQLADMISYSRPIYLVLTRSLGLVTTVLIIIYSGLRIYKDRGRS